MAKMSLPYSFCFLLLPVVSMWLLCDCNPAWLGAPLSFCYYLWSNLHECIVSTLCTSYCHSQNYCSQTLWCTNHSHALLTSTWTRLCLPCVLLPTLNCHLFCLTFYSLMLLISNLHRDYSCCLLLTRIQLKLFHLSEILISICLLKTYLWRLISNEFHYFCFHGLGLKSFAFLWIICLLHVHSSQTLFCTLCFHTNYSLYLYHLLFTNSSFHFVTTPTPILPKRNILHHNLLSF